MESKRVTIDELATLRDELRVQAQLFKGEAKSKWESLEADYKRLKAAKPTVKATLESAGKDVEAAGELLKESLYNDYVKIRKTLSRPS